MFEYLTALHDQEEQRYKVNPIAYEEEIKKYQEIVASTRGWYMHPDSMYTNFLDNPQEYINYFMAFTVKYIASKSLVSPQNKINIFDLSEPFCNEYLLKRIVLKLPVILVNDQNQHFQNIFASYIWTSLMILGFNIPDQNKRFDGNSLLTSIYFDRLNRNQIGYFSRFSSESLYETQFKKYLRRDRVAFYLSNSNFEIVERKRHAHIDEQKRQEKIDIDLKKKLAIESEKKTQDELKLEKKRHEENVKRQENITIAQALQNSKELFSYIEQFDAKVRGVSKRLDTAADINYQDSADGYTPLMLAVNNQNDQVAEYLLNEGANPFIKNKNNKIASELASRSSPIFTILKGYELLYSVFNRDFLTIKTLLKSGADINFQGLGGYTPLLVAVELSFIEIVDFILSQDADLTLVRSDGQSVFDLVKNESVLELLESANSLNEVADQTSEDDSFDNSSNTPGFFDTLSHFMWNK